MLSAFSFNLHFFFQVVCRPCPAKWSSLQKAGCIFTWRKNWFKMTSLQKASASNMILTYHYVSTMSGEPTPFFCINQLFLSALYVTQAPSKSRGNPNGDIFRISLGTLWDFHEVSWEFLWQWWFMIFLLDSCGISTVFLWCFYGISLGFLWGSWWNSMGFLWDFFVVPMLFPCYFYDLSMRFLWDSYGISMIFLWDYYGMSIESTVSWNQFNINAN